MLGNGLERPESRAGGWRVVRLVYLWVGGSSIKPFNVTQLAQQFSLLGFPWLWD